MAYSANKTTLSYYNASSTADDKYDEINYLMEVPEFGGAPEKIDVTTLSDDVKQYIPGTKDYGDLVFKFLYESGIDGNYKVLKGLEEAYSTTNVPTKFKLEYPDGSAHEFNAIPFVKMDAGAINGALTFTATMVINDFVA